MSKTGLDHQTANGEALITEIKDLRKIVEQLRTAQKQGGDVITVSFGGPYDFSGLVGSPGIYSLFVAAVTDLTETIPVYATASFTFYEDVIDDAHEVGIVSNVLSTHWKIWIREDQKRSTLYKQTWVIDLQNLDSVAHTLYMRVHLRWAITR